MNYALQKGTKWVTQYQRLAKPSKGVSAKYMRQFFISIAIPKMLYAADLFLIPGTNKTRGTKGFISKLAKVQRQASLHIMGALRSALTDAIDAFVDLLPFHLLVKKYFFWAATRLATLLQSHPMHKHAIKAALRYVKSHQAPVHEILHTFDIRPTTFEKIKPYHHSPKHCPWLTTHIIPNKEEAVLAARNLMGCLAIFSDGSGQDR